MEVLGGIAASGANGGGVRISPGRRRISDEAFVALGDDLSDEQYNGRVADRFGIALR